MTAEKHLFPVDKTSYQLNKSVFENGSDIIEENIASIAPNINKKFNELHPGNLCDYYLHNFCWHLLTYFMRLLSFYIS